MSDGGQGSGSGGARAADPDGTAPVVGTDAGPVRGGARPGGGLAFRGVPYAAPPTGDLRWRPPAPPRPWTAVRDATRPGPAAWQPSGGPLEGLVPGMAPAVQGDDCLTLDVWTPAVDGARRPVMVWIHGGGFSLGAGSLPVYAGERLCTEQDVVVVAPNYRLGAFGFLCLDDPSAAANVGLLDQVAALRWVRDHAARLGGDPDDVTVFGESAGAGSVLSLLSMPAARGLFHRAVVQSGATDLLLDRDRATAVADALCRAAGVDPGDVEGLRALPAAGVLDAQARAAAELFATVGTMPFHPCVDGEVLPATWLEAAVAGDGGVPLIIGTTRDEMALFSAMDPGLSQLDDAALRRRLARLGVDADAVVDAYRTAGVAAPPAVWTRVQTDTQMWMPALAVTEAWARHGPVWAYRFDLPAAGAGLGACHGVDIPFPFGTVAVDGWEPFLGDPAAAEALSATVRSLWGSFARDGRPAAPGIDWPTYDAERATLVLDRHVRVVDDPDAAVRRLWQGGS